MTSIKIARGYGIGLSRPVLHAKEIQTKKELLVFANSVSFPSRGLILRSSMDNVSDVKGVSEVDQLFAVFSAMIQKHTKVWVESDSTILKHQSCCIDCKL